MFQSHMRFCLTQWSATRFYNSLSVYSRPLPSEKNSPLAAQLKIAFRRFFNRVVDRHNDSTCERTRDTWLCTRFENLICLTTPVYQFGRIYTARTSSEKHFPQDGTFTCSSSLIRWKNVNN